MQEFAPAKVNLFLHVTGRQPDGYHTLDSLAVFPGVGDTVHAELADALTLHIEGPFAAGLAEADNLVLRTAYRLQQAAGTTQGASLVLDKQLPVASGIGGGSADAAATLRLLSRLWGLALPPASLGALAAELGADVPVCLLSQPSRMSGKGEMLGIAPVLPRCGIVLLNPGAPVSTAAVFAARTEAFREPAVLPARWADAATLATDLAALSNDLEAPARTLCPAIDAALAWLHAQPGCLLARMSGSGATCFGLFAEPPDLPAPPDGWWHWSGALAG